MKKEHSYRKWLFTVLVLVMGASFFYTCQAMGKKADGERLIRMQSSPQWKDGQFVNPQPLINDFWMALGSMFRQSVDVNPKDPVPVVYVEKSRFSELPESGLRVTWFGHSSSLIELDGVRILTDPIWSDRTSPSSWIGPKRWYPALISLDDLPEIDAVLISHDHYDHMDFGTITKLKDRKILFVVPLGLGANLSYWGVPTEKIVELDWWETKKINGLEIISTPARHASGRYLLDNDEKLWSSYALLGPKHRVYFSGDTGLFPKMKEIGEKYGPFDLTMIETGQYNQAWPDWHIGPEQAVIAHTQLKGKVLLPIHWGLFALASHGWTEPIERVLEKSKELGVTVITPKPGESSEPGLQKDYIAWWPKLPYNSAKEDPILSSQLEESTASGEVIK